VAGFDAVLLDYDWRRDVAILGKLLAERIAADGRDQVALIGHSMGGLVARAALTHAAGARVSQLVMLGTPNSGSLAAVQALRGTYSVVRKIAMLDLRHDAFSPAKCSRVSPAPRLLPTGESSATSTCLSLKGLRRAQGQHRVAAHTPTLVKGWPGGQPLSHGGAAIAPRPRVWHRAAATSNTSTACVVTAQPIDLAQPPDDNRYVAAHSDLPLSDRVIAGWWICSRPARRGVSPLHRRDGSALSPA
jgi:pimeloyl-ACP methyl ester carboxylesterase